MNDDGEGPPVRFERRMVGDAQRNGRVVFVPVPMRWLAYKPGSQQLKHGIKGRWQTMNDYGWTNADFTPEFYLHDLSLPD
jgi:hypothetical protein